jgi:hypothetical protein
MPKCDHCSTTILFGGEKRNGYRFCNNDCLQKGAQQFLVEPLPDELVTKLIDSIHHGSCPKCGGAGPIDVHTSHQVWSIVVFTSWKSKPQLCCRTCGIKAKLGDSVFSAVAGWWGFPWGMIATPVQIGRNLVGIVGSRNGAGPSVDLEHFVRRNFAGEVLTLLDQQPSEE